METKNEPIPKEIVAATATEPEESINWGIMVAKNSITSISLEQRCLLCDNTRELPTYMSNHISPWVCDECKEAIAYIKEVKKRRVDSLLHE